MSDLCKLIWCALIGPFRPRAALQAENLVLRHQLNVLRRKSPQRLAFGNVDRVYPHNLIHAQRIAFGITNMSGFLRLLSGWGAVVSICAKSPSGIA
jgi:hypothetical protein